MIANLTPIQRHEVKMPMPLQSILPLSCFISMDIKYLKQPKLSQYVRTKVSVRCT